MWGKVFKDGPSEKLWKATFKEFEVLVYLRNGNTENSVVWFLL